MFSFCLFFSLFSLMTLSLRVNDLLGRLLNLIPVAAKVLGALFAAGVIVLELTLGMLARQRDTRVVGRQLGVHGAREVDALLFQLLFLFVHALTL